MELNFWTGTEFVGGEYNEDKSCWTVDLKRSDGTLRKVRPSHLVMATSVSGIPNIPTIPTLEEFSGEIMHSSEFTSADSHKDRRVLVVGTGTSAHDIAQDLHSNGAKVCLLQRSPTSVVNVEPSAQLPYTLYDEGHSLDDTDLIATATPLQALKSAHELITKQSTHLDKDLLDGLTKVGF